MFGAQFDDQMSDKNIGENPKKQPHSTPSPIDKNPDSAPDHHDQPPQPLPLTVAVGGSPFLSPPPPPPPPPAAPPLYISTEQSSVVNPKRPRFTTTTSSTATGQWKLLPSPPQKQILVSGDSTPPTTATNNPPPTSQPAAALTASSSDTANSSPSHSPRPSLSNPLAQETSKPDQGSDPHHYPQQQQFRKGKYVSPVWKPNEMLWLARAWRVQYGGGGGSQDHHHYNLPEIHEVSAPAGRAKTRAEKDKEVAEFLNRHGVNRDAKTAGTKWDNMLGEFRKVYEWERGGERDQIGKSYFRLSPYERKLHRLPASFDEGVFEELSQFMGARMRTTAINTVQTTTTTSTSSRGASPFLPAAGDHLDTTTSRVLAIADTKSFPPAGPSFREDDQFLPFSGSGGRGSRQEGYFHAVRGNMFGMDQGLIEHGGGGVVGSSTSGTTELRRIGKIKMIWEEQVSLWGEEGEYHRGRVKVKSLSFLNADELAFLDESESMVPCTLESFEDSPPPSSSSPLKGFSVDKFVSGQQVKVFGRRKSCSPPSSFSERLQLASTEPFTRSFISAWEFQDPTEYYLGCLRVPPQTLPSLIELPWYLQEPPPDELRFPLRKDVYRDLPQGKELLFATSSELFDCKALTFDILSPMIRSNPSLASMTTATSRDSFIGLWDDCINRVLSKFCNQDMVFIRKPSISSPDAVQDQWPNVTGFVKNYCLWRGEETDQLREGSDNPASLIVQKLLWSYLDLPYIFGYYAVGYIVTFCALNRSQDRIIRTDLITVDLSTPAERIKALVPCWRIAGLLPLLADRCLNSHINNNNNIGSTGSSTLKIVPYSDFEMVELGNGNVLELTPNSMTRVFPSRRKWGAAKEIYDFLDHRIPHSEYIFRSSEKDLSITFKPRGCKSKPVNLDQLVDALKQVTKALVALHDLSFMHRDLCWDKVMKRCDRDNEWFVVGFEEATTAPQMMYYGVHMHDGVGTGTAAGSGKHAPEMKGRGMHGVKVDVWGVGQLVKTCGLVGVPKVLRELQNRCLDHNPEQRPTAADCYHHLLQLQSSMSSAVAGAY